MARRLRESAFDGKRTIELSELAASVADAVLAAKMRLDQQAVAIAAQCKASPALKNVSPPAFALGEVGMVLKVAIARVERQASPRQRVSHGVVHVLVDLASLASVEPQLISEVELRIAPATTR